MTNYWAALQSNAQSKNRGRLVCTAKRQNGGRIRFSAPLPPPPFVAKLRIFEGKGWVISDKNYGRGTMNKKQQITLTFND